VKGQNNVLLVPKLALQADKAEDPAGASLQPCDEMETSLSEALGWQQGKS